MGLNVNGGLLTMDPMYLDLLEPPCWELNGEADPTVAFATIFELFESTDTLVIESAIPSKEALLAMVAISDRTGESETTVNGDTGRGYRFEFRLGRTIPEELVAICENHAEPEYCDVCFVFRNGRPILLWWDFPENFICLRPELSTALVSTFAERTGLTPERIEE